MMGAGELGVAEEGESPHESRWHTKTRPSCWGQAHRKIQDLCKVVARRGMSSIELQRETSATSSDSGVAGIEEWLSELN